LTGAGGAVIVTGAAGATTGAAGSTGAAGAFTGSAGASATGAAGTGPADAGTDGGGAQCLISIAPVGSDSLMNLEASPNKTLRLHATVSGYPGAPDGGGVPWRWFVSPGANVDAGIDVTHVDDATIEITLNTPGTYQVQATIDGAPYCDRAPVTFVVKVPQAPSLLFRVTPPAGLQLPVRETPLTTSSIANDSTLDLGDAKASELVSLLPVDARGFSIPSYIRITSPKFTFDLEGWTGRGAFVVPLSTDLPYSVLVLPDGAVAPTLVSGLLDALSTSVPMSPGVNVTGTLRDGKGNPVVGARAILMAGALPSTVGVSGADGTLGLLARQGTFSADILPPAGSGLPEALVTGSPGIVLLPGATDLNFSMDWAKVPAAALTIAVTGPGGAPVAGARVRVDLATPLANAGTLSVSGVTTPLQATGSAHADGVTDAQGAAHLGLLPTGSYHVIVAPPDGASSVAITLQDVYLPAAGATAPIALAAPVTLAGTIAGVGTVAGAKITAIDHGLLASATLATATTGADGSYKLPLAVGRTYELVVEPDPKSGLARTVLNLETPTAMGNVRFDTITPAVAWKGSVTGAGRAVAGALVQVFCAPRASCIDPDLALAQGTTAADGSITLSLPAAAPP
jgi:hypothetical protein